MRDPAFFIVGFPRSGTTLLASVLARHPEVAVPPETGLLMPFNRQRLRAIRSGDRTAATTALAEVLAGWPIDARNVMASLSTHSLIPHAADVMRAILNHYAAHVGKGISGEKTPGHLRRAFDLADWFPHARFIGLIRDGRDALPSLMKLPGKSDSAVLHALYYNRDARVLLRLQRELGDRFLLIKFEELVSDLSAHVAAVDGFLGLRFHPAQLDTSQQTGVTLANEHWKENVAKAIDPSRAMVWKRTGLSHELRQAERIMDPALRRLGYDAASPFTSTQRYAAIARAACERVAGGIVWRLKRRRTRQTTRVDTVNSLSSPPLT